jgi:hypothetical protein
VLSGQPELEQKLRHPSVRQLRQRIAVWCKTVPLTAEQTNSYITERLRIAGATDSIFDPHAVQQIHYFSKGIPRLINLLCDHVLINGYVEQLRPIPARIVDGVAAELEFELFEPNPMLDDLPEIPSEIIPQLDLQDAMEVTVPGKDLA